MKVSFAFLVVLLGLVQALEVKGSSLLTHNLLSRPRTAHQHAHQDTAAHGMIVVVLEHRRPRGCAALRPRSRAGPSHCHLSVTPLRIAAISIPPAPSQALVRV